MITGEETHRDLGVDTGMSQKSAAAALGALLAKKKSNSSQIRAKVSLGDISTDKEKWKYSKPMKNYDSRILLKRQYISINIDNRYALTTYSFDFECIETQNDGIIPLKFDLIIPIQARICSFDAQINDKIYKGKISHSASWLFGEIYVDDMGDIKCIS